MFKSAIYWIRENLAPGTFIMVGILAITTLVLTIGEAEIGATIAWAVMFSYGLFIYNISFSWLLPMAYQKRYPLLRYILTSALTTICLSLSLIIVVFIFSGDADAEFNLSLFNFVVQLIVTTPVTWWIYKRQQAGKEQITILKRELRQSTASIDLLRSQINPHFLFNILNALYGTALQEKADRTSEGIQRLGDMMRFMLHENLLERIDLSREIEYLKDYITLQRLRIDTSSDIHVDVDIPSETPHLTIAPMLLIPFVENAFKHGISFREPSYIRIVMTIKNNSLFFDVTNSTHPAQEKDLERNSNGIGLVNVRQRLALTYPKKHELIVKESGKDFFVHLTIQLS